jgi:hypothetical protein
LDIINQIKTDKRKDSNIRTPLVPEEFINKKGIVQERYEEGVLD